MSNPWVDKPYARGAWPDAAKISDDRLDQLLDIAYEACASYAPTITAPALVPARYAEAVVLVARATWTAARASSDGLGLNDGTDLALPTPVLGSQALQLLRPPGPVVLG
jgi:hypothetical protein